MLNEYGLETKFCRLGEEITLTDGSRIEGYASFFGMTDQGGDVVMPGAYGKSLSRLKAEGRDIIDLSAGDITGNDEPNGPSKA